MDFLRIYANEYNPLFICVTESWTHSGILDSELQLQGYHCFRKDRQKKKGGGVLLYIANKFKSNLLVNLTSGYYSECVWCKVRINDQTSLLIGVIYRPPDSKSLDETLMLKLLHNATQHKSTFKLIVDDFNYPEIDGQITPVVTIS